MSLIEVMIAGTILVIVIASAAGSIALGFNLIADRRYKTMAESVAASHMELLVATTQQRYLDADDCVAVTYSREIEAGGTLFTASCLLVPNTPVVTLANRFARLTVSVTYRHLGRDHTVNFSTYVESEPS
jgi:Tfp pilus assembly protein PilV